jgi:hypothetical protein
MPQKDWYGQSIIFLILFFLACSALGIAYNDIVRMDLSGGPAAALAHHSLTLPVSFPATEIRDAEPWRPVVILENLGTDEATIEVALLDANGTEPPGTFAEGSPISLSPGGSMTIPLAGAKGLPAGHYSVELSSNQPITGTVLHQATAGEMQNSDL